jgi:hypothetical protein
MDPLSPAGAFRAAIALATPQANLAVVESGGDAEEAEEAEEADGNDSQLTGSVAGTPRSVISTSDFGAIA